MNLGEEQRVLSHCLKNLGLIFIACFLAAQVFGGLRSA